MLFAWSSAAPCIRLVSWLRYFWFSWSRRGAASLEKHKRYVHMMLTWPTCDLTASILKCEQPEETFAELQRLTEVRYLSLGPGREVRGCGELTGCADWDHWETCSRLDDSGLAAIELRDEFWAWRGEWEMYIESNAGLTDGLTAQL